MHNVPFWYASGCLSHVRSSYGTQICMYLPLCVRMHALTKVKEMARGNKFRELNLMQWFVSL